MKTFRLFSMAAVALMMAACSNNDDNEILQNTQQPGTMHFTATIAAPSGDATTRTVYTKEGATINVKWAVDDEIALVHNGVKDVARVTAVDGSGNATIEATITGSPSDDDVVTLAYPANAVVSATPYDPFPFTPNPDIFDKVKYHQDGTLAYIQNNLDLRMGSGQLAVSGSDVTLKGSVSVSSLICIWKLTLEDESSNPLSATQLTFKNNTATQAKATSAAKSEYYLCVVPSFIPDPSGTFSFEATVGGYTYTFSKTGLSLAAGNYYQSTLKMAAAVLNITSPSVGQVIGIDGKNYDAGSVPVGVTAVAKICYVSGSSGLALALTDEGKMNWSTAQTTCAAHTPAFTGGTWKLATKDEWSNIISAAGSYTDLRDGFSSVGGSNMNKGYYWSSTEDGTDYAKACHFGDMGGGGWFSMYKTSDGYNVRACLAF